MVWTTGAFDERGFLNPGFGDETELEVLQIDMGKVLSREELLEVARLLSRRVHAPGQPRAAASARDPFTRVPRVVARQPLAPSRSPASFNFRRDFSHRPCLAHVRSRAAYVS